MVKAAHSVLWDPRSNPRRAKLFLFCIYYLVVHYDGIKEKNKTILTELPILTQRLTPRTLDPVTRARISGGPNFFIFFTKGCNGRLQTDTVFLYFFTKRWRQSPSLPVLVLKPEVIASIIVGCSNRHRRPTSLSVFKLKPTVMCRCSSHANSAPMTTIVGTLFPPTPTTLVQK